MQSISHSFRLTFLHFSITTWWRALFEFFRFPNWDSKIDLKNLPIPWSIALTISVSVSCDILPRSCNHRISKEQGPDGGWSCSCLKCEKALFLFPTPHFMRTNSLMFCTFSSFPDSRIPRLFCISAHMYRMCQLQKPFFAHFFPYEVTERRWWRLEELAWHFFFV